MNTTLLIMAAGIGSRFGTGIKQLEPVDDANHIIMDYSIHDAIEAGFNHVVFIIRKDIENEFKEVIGDRIAGICSEHNVTVDYAFQDINDIPSALPEGRTKPWGTGQAVLAAKDVLTTPFIVINADDYYGKEGFRAVHEHLVNGGQSCMAGFVLKNTLSDNGGVTRGICKMDAENNLTEVVETKNIVKTAEGAEADEVKLDVDSLVSMNMWGLTPDFLKTLEEGFKEFFEKEVPANPLKTEYLIPTFIGELLSEGKMSVKVLRTNDTWYGMTYKEDVAAVKESFSNILDYKCAENLFAFTHSILCGGDGDVKDHVYHCVLDSDNQYKKMEYCGDHSLGDVYNDFSFDSSAEHVIIEGDEIGCFNFVFGYKNPGIYKFNYVVDYVANGKEHSIKSKKYEVYLPPISEVNDPGEFDMLDEIYKEEGKYLYDRIDNYYTHPIKLTRKMTEYLEVLRDAQ